MSGATSERPEPVPWGALSPREVRVAVMIVNGETRREIASALVISARTYDTHRGNVLRKLKCRTEVALVRLALERGWATL